MRLRRQEKIFLSAAVAVVIGYVFVFRVMLPSRQRFRTLEQKIVRKEQELKEMYEQRSRYDRFLQLEREVQTALQKREKNFFSPTLWARLAEKAKIPKERFRQEIKQPPHGQNAQEYKDISAHFELDGVTLEQLTRFIYEIEAEDAFLKVRNLILQKTEKTPGVIKAEFDVTTQIR